MCIVGRVRDRSSLIWFVPKRPPKTHEVMGDKLLIGG